MGLISFGAGWALRAARRGSRSSRSNSGLSDHSAAQYDDDLELRFERLAARRTVLFHPEITDTSLAHFWRENALLQFRPLAKYGSAATLVLLFLLMLFLAISIESFYALVVPYSSLGETLLATALLLGVPGLGQIVFGQAVAPAIMFWKINRSFKREGWDTKTQLYEIGQMHRESR